MAVFAVVDKAGLQGGFDAGDNRLVNIAFALFAPFNLDLVVEQFLSIHNRQAAFFRLGGVNQHPFHGCILLNSNSHARYGQTMPELTHEPRRNCRRAWLPKKASRRRRVEWDEGTLVCRGEDFANAGVRFPGLR